MGCACVGVAIRAVAERSPRITQLVARFAATAEARVFAPSYRLAPEHPCPAAVEDILAADAWAREAARQLIEESL